MGREQQREIITKKLEEKALKITSWVGSTESIIIHTIVFGFFILMIILGANIDTVMLVLTTIVSLEAIYLAIFIQMSVNRQAMKIAEVSEDIVEIQEDVEGIEKDIDEIQVDIDEIQEDVSGIEEDIDEIQEDIDEIQEDVEDIEEDLGDNTQTKSAQSKTVVKQTNDELIALIKNLNKEIIDLKSEIKSLQKPAPSKTESLKQKVTKLLKK